MSLQIKLPKIDIKDRERKFKCGCGKSYLSYSALYTHVKIKHDGSFPPRSSMKHDPESLTKNQNYSITKKNEKFEIEFKYFINTIKNGNSETNEKKVKKEEINNLFHFLNSKNLEYVDTYKINFLEVLKSKEKDFKKKIVLNIYGIISNYLLKIYPFCSESFFKDYFLFSFLIISVLNTKGVNYLTFSEKESFKDINEFSLSYNIHVIGDVLNSICVELFPYLYGRMEKIGIEFVFLGFEKEQLKNLLLMSKFMANWMFDNKFIDYKLEIDVALKMNK